MNGGSGDVILTGRLICKNAREAAIVERYLPRHIELTRAEPGCVSFAVTPTATTYVWQVDERFTDMAAFEAHQRRVTQSEWGIKTAGIERDYSIGSTE